MCGGVGDGCGTIAEGGMMRVVGQLACQVNMFSGIVFRVTSYWLSLMPMWLLVIALFEILIPTISLSQGLLEHSVELS